MGTSGEKTRNFLRCWCALFVLWSWLYARFAMHLECYYASCANTTHSITWAFHYECKDENMQTPGIPVHLWGCLEELNHHVEFSIIYNVYILKIETVKIIIQSFQNNWKRLWILTYNGLWYMLHMYYHNLAIVKVFVTEQKKSYIGPLIYPLIYSEFLQIGPVNWLQWGWGLKMYKSISAQGTPK